MTFKLFVLLNAGNKNRAARSLYCADDHTKHRWSHHRNGCSHRFIEQCSWPQCNPTCPKLHNPFTGEEMDFMELLKSFGLDKSSVASALGIDVATLNAMDHSTLLQLLTHQQPDNWKTSSNVLFVIIPLLIILYCWLFIFRVIIIWLGKGGNASSIPKCSWGIFLLYWFYLGTDYQIAGLSVYHFCAVWLWPVIVVNGGKRVLSNPVFDFRFHFLIIDGAPYQLIWEL